MSLRKIPAGNPVHCDLKRVLESGMRATDLVRQILTFSRQSEQEQKPVHMTPIIKESLKLLRSSLPATIEIRQENTLGNNRDLVLADQTQLHQVLMNLGTNAAHAMRANGGALRVNLTEFEVDTTFVSRHPNLRPGPYLKLTVTDTGHGMEPAVMERIFDPYFTTKDVGEGTGMGLAVVQGIVHSHGGEITVYSEPGRGTAFHVFLPRFEGDTNHEEKTEDVVIGGTERVLFVDDEALLADLGQELLESLGYTVTVTLRSREALKLFNSDPQAFDLVITDMTMPGLTGRELARNLLSIRPDIPIILCTGFSEQTKGKQIMEIGIREVITKPYVLHTIATTIRRVLDKTAVS
jgi:CheY-like chemotaxis protein